MERLEAVEGLPLNVDPATAQIIRERLVALREELRPRIPFVAGGDANLVLNNLVGSVQLAPNLVLDVAPKTQADTNWAAAIIDLLVDERAHYGGETEFAEAIPKMVLPDVYARLYVDQLDRAVRREGPLAVLERRNRARPALTGRLDVTTWVTTRSSNPAMFPQSQTELTVDNAYTTAMSWVAEALAARSSDPRLAARLRSFSTRLRPGHPTHAAVDPSVALRDIPPQWRAYRPAWATASAFIRRIAPLHRWGTLAGFGLAVEPWPLLERLLHRGLRSAVTQAADEGLALRAVEHAGFPLLTRKGGPTQGGLSRLHASRNVDPDGSLWRGDTIVATFEAKYSVPNADRFRTHYFQALSSAAALDSPLAVLVYPEAAPALTWDVSGFNGKPERLVAVGLDMYNYRYGVGDAAVGQVLLDVVRSTAAAGTPQL
jgi:hypothetical protein